MDNQEILEAVDSIADDIEGRIENLAEQLGLSSDELMDRVSNEVKARLEQD